MTADTLAGSRSRSLTVSIALWGVQIALAAMFGFVGYTKVVTPIPELAAMMGWPGDVPLWLVRFVGISELLGAIGLILPVATGILPRLTALAALGLAVIMVLAVGLHVMRAEYGIIPFNVVLFALNAFVIWGRRDGN